MAAHPVYAMSCRYGKVYVVVIRRSTREVQKDENTSFYWDSEFIFIAKYFSEALII